MAIDLALNELEGQLLFNRAKRSNTNADIAMLPLGSICQTFSEGKQHAYTVIRQEISSIQGRMTRLKQRICQLEGQVVLWKRRHNFLSTTSRLPPELLGEIFVYIQEQYIPTKNDLGWIKLTHVCSHWRNVALSQPSLWAAPQFDHPRLAMEMIFRAQSLPLSIHVSLPHPLPPPLKSGVQLAFAALHRARQLIVNLPEYQTHGQAVKRTLHLHHYLRTPAPLLEAFGINAAGDSTEKSCLPEDLFNGYAPKLTKMCLLDWNIPWNSPSLGIYRNLRSLWVVCKTPHRTHMPQYPIREVVPALAELPNLEELILKSPFLPLNEMDLIWHSRGHTVELPKLKVLRMLESPRACQVFLAHVAMPDDAYIVFSKLSNPWISGRIDTYSPNEDRDAALDLLQCLRWRIRSFRFTDGNFEFWNVLVKDLDLDHSGRRPSRRTRANSRPHLTLRGFLHDWDLQSLCRSGWLDDVEVVSIYHFLIDMMSGPRNIWRGFGALKELRELHVVLDDIHFLNELAPGIQVHSTNRDQDLHGNPDRDMMFVEPEDVLMRSPMVSFPSLEILVCSFEEDAFSGEYQWQEALHLLTCAIRSRRELGYGPRLVRLVFERGTTNHGNLATLQDEVEVELI